MKQRSLADLINCWNRATNPAAYRTDHTQARCRVYARALLKRLAASGYREGKDFCESDYSGRLIATGIYREDT